MKGKGIPGLFQQPGVLGLQIAVNLYYVADYALVYLFDDPRYAILLLFS
jgi:hypothetical protein